MKLNACLSGRFYQICENVKNSKNREDLNFNFGVACGFSSALFLAHTIDIDCYKAMREYMGTAHDIWLRKRGN